MKSGENKNNCPPANVFSPRRYKFLTQLMFIPSSRSTNFTFHHFQYGRNSDKVTSVPRHKNCLFPAIRRLKFHNILTTFTRFVQIYALFNLESFTSNNFNRNFVFPPPVPAQIRNNYLLFTFMHFPGQRLVECFVLYPHKSKQKSLALLSKTKKTLDSNLPSLNCCQNQAKYI